MPIPTREEMYKALEERHGADIQKKLSAAKVAVCGLGGLGSNIAIALARAGVGKLHIIDFDTVDISNLNRHSTSPISLVSQSHRHFMIRFTVSHPTAR